MAFAVGTYLTGMAITSVSGYVTGQWKEYSKEKYEFKRRVTELQVFFDTVYQKKQSSSDAHWCTLNKLKSEYLSIIESKKYLWVKRGPNMRCISSYKVENDKYLVPIDTKVISKAVLLKKSEIKKKKKEIYAAKHPSIWAVNENKIKELEDELIILQKQANSLVEDQRYINDRIENGYVPLEENQVYLGVYPPLYPPPCNTFLNSRVVVHYITGWESLYNMVSNAVFSEAKTIKQFMLSKLEPIRKLSDTLKAVSMAMSIEENITRHRRTNGTVPKELKPSKPAKDTVQNPEFKQYVKNYF